jgi:LysW-gamma-L-lysine carboxypeptidase
MTAEGERRAGLRGEPQGQLAPEVPATLAGLVARYSPTGAVAEAVDWLVARMGALGFTRAFVDEAGNAVGVMGAGPRQAVLLGHIDTVPGEPAVRVADGRLYGRGAVDAKGPLAAFVDAVAAAGAPAGWQLIVIGACDEEGGSRGARHVAGRYRPEWALIGEPSGWDRVTLGYRGSLWAEVAVERPLSHTASGEESACEAAVTLWNQLAAACAARNAGQARVFDQLSATLRGLHSQSDGLTERAALRVGLRLPEGLAPAECRVWLEGLAGDGVVALEDEPLPAYRAPKNTRLVRALLAAIRAQGGTPGFSVKSGTSDLNVVGPVWGCPLAAYGPGDARLDHTPDEHLVLADYERAVAVLGSVLRAAG